MEKQTIDDSILDEITIEDVLKKGLDYNDVRFQLLRRSQENRMSTTLKKAGYITLGDLKRVKNASSLKMTERLLGIVLPIAEEYGIVFDDYITEERIYNGLLKGCQCVFRLTRKERQEMEFKEGYEIDRLYWQQYQQSVKGVDYLRYVIHPKYFEQGSKTMDIIATAIDKYLKTIADEILKKDFSHRGYEKAKTQISEIRDKIEACIDDKRDELPRLKKNRQLEEEKRLQEIETEKTKQERITSYLSDISKMTGDIKHYHHNPKQSHEDVHYNNPFANNEREL